MATVSKKKSPFRIVYIDPKTKEQYEVLDSKKESRFVPGTEKEVGLPIAPSHHDRDAINFDVTQKLLEENPSLKPYLVAGDIVDKRELDAFLAGDATKKTVRKPAVKKTAKK